MKNKKMKKMNTSTLVMKDHSQFTLENLIATNMKIIDITNGIIIIKTLKTATTDAVFAGYSLAGKSNQKGSQTATKYIISLYKITLKFYLAEKITIKNSV